MKNIIVLCLLFFHSSLCVKKYTNYTLFRSMPYNEEQLKFLKEVSSLIKVDYWLPPGRVNKPVDIMVNPDDKEVFFRSMDEKKINYTSVIDDVQRAFDLQTVQPYIRRKMDTFDWTSYYTLDDIYNWMRDLAHENPKEVTLLNLGKTYENRDILGVKIVLQGCKRRSAVIVEGGVHAREWIAPAFVTFLISRILKSRKNPQGAVGKIAYLYEFYMVPVLNPDGYEYSMVKDRMWRKNRFKGYGVDINRNFDSAFGTVGVSLSQQSETYCGQHAFSEKESRAMQGLVRSVKDKLEYYLAFHAYGQYMIIPYAYSKRHDANFDEVYNILSKANTKLSRRYKTKYTVGTAFDTVGYLTSGVSGCWAKAAYKVPYVVTFELPDTGTYGFALPPKRISRICWETLDGIQSILEPKTVKPRKLQHTGNAEPEKNIQQKNILNPFVVTFNLVFIILRYS